ncbi:alpha/beta fold hydrolase [Nocardioides sp. Arc9.136]|uniref:alpha/beta fold hydrolase n=1 Tax=Nocardioides sp. Arc9.136 TaxID=2996826 RepID=UPI002665967C|nr:alpha/beta fold hydrolase [Nocardioides sp. Arc9.136]WKN50557.1 alpha/beta fold hydrolase [Nocardioides sp. Arc9.136]
MSTEETRTVHSTEVGGPGGARTVFLHGLFGQGKNFTQAARALEPDLHSLLVDLPNHGRSGWTDSVDYVDVADAVAEHLRRGFAADGPVHLVGHSMGGKVAMVLALRHPDLVDRLVVVDISPTGSGGTGEFEHLLDSLSRLDLAAVVRRADADRLLTADIPDERVRGFLLQNLRSHGPDFRWQANLALLRAELETIGGFPDTSVIGGESFDHPVLWLAGDRSPYIRPEHDATMRRLFPRTRLVTIKGAGHWVHSEQPEAFVSALRVFLTA